MRPFFLYLDDIATFLGIVSNALLIVAVKKRTAKNFRSYGNMVLVSALIDLTYAIVIMACHHQLQFVDGAMLITSYALDPYLPVLPKLMLGSLEHFFVLEAIIILPAQYWYRYYLITNSNPENDNMFFMAVGGTLLASSGMAVNCVLSNLAAIKKRGDDYYIRLLDPSIIHGDPKDTFASVVDMKDWESWCYIGWAGLVINICYCGAVYYCYKSITGIAPALSGGLSKKARQMKAAFTRNLIVQTTNSFVFCMLPMFIIMLTMFFKFEFGRFNFCFMTLMAWAPAANGIFSLMIIRPYRKFIFRTEASSISPTKTGGGTSRTNISVQKSSDVIH
ncbi:hypothetical protein M3Y95_00282100 [Aphelenchoides besseyi]|nr:hypothetical protein M3Y95_00282100 [Aphelenchoides besseyi]